MKNAFLLFTLSLFLLASCGNKPDSEQTTSVMDSLKEIPADKIVAPSDTDQFGFKTGVIVYTSSTMGITQNITMWFDDFGRKTLSEIESTMLGQKIHQLNIALDSIIYNIDMVAKEGTWSTAKQDTTEKKYNYRKLTAEDKKLHNITDEGKETILGKDCAIYGMKENVDGQDIVMKVWIWEGIPMKSESSVSGIDVTMEALEIKVNIEVPASKFQVPKGVKMEKSIEPESLPS